MKLFYFVLAVCFVGGSLIEYWVTRKEHRFYYSLYDFRTSFQLMISSLLVDIVLKSVAIVLFNKLAVFAVFRLGYEWWTWILCYVAWDLIFYLKHYMEHNVRFMWAIHVNHHSSPYMNLSTSLRSGVFKSGYRFFFWAIIVLIGFPIPMFLTLYGAGKIWAFFSHSQRLGHWGILERFVITPSHHLVHHSSNKENLNSNFGETFLIWDKLFGTFKKHNGPLSYGIAESVDHASFNEVVFHEFKVMRRELRAASGMKQYLRIIFGRPNQY